MNSNSATEIRKSRDGSWNAVSFRRHELLKVFAGDEMCEDLMFLCRVSMSFRNGSELDMEFAGRLKISGPKTDTPKLKLYQVWAVGSTGTLFRFAYQLIQKQDSAPMVAAMKGPGK